MHGCTGWTGSNQNRERTLVRISDSLASVRRPMVSPNLLSEKIASRSGRTLLPGRNLPAIQSSALIGISLCGMVSGSLLRDKLSSPHIFHRRHPPPTPSDGPSRLRGRRMERAKMTMSPIMVSLSAPECRAARPAMPGIQDHHPIRRNRS